MLLFRLFKATSIGVCKYVYLHFKEREGEGNAIRCDTMGEEDEEEEEEDRNVPVESKRKIKVLPCCIHNISRRKEYHTSREYV